MRQEVSHLEDWQQECLDMHGDCHTAKQHRKHSRHAKRHLERSMSTDEILEAWSKRIS